MTAPSYERCLAHCHGCNRLVGTVPGRWECSRCGFENAGTHRAVLVKGCTSLYRCEDCGDNL